MSVFEVKYYKKGKTKGTRKIKVEGCSLTYEDVLFRFLLNHLCQRNYFHHYEWFMLNNHVFVKQLSANALICEYEVLLFDMSLKSKLISEYKVEIECVENNKTIDVCLQTKKLREPKQSEIQKEKLPTDWFINESRAVKYFLLLLHEYGNIENLKKSRHLSKATFYRNLRLCETKGYIKDGKLVKRLYVFKKI